MTQRVSELVSDKIAALGIYFAFQVHDSHSAAIDPWHPFSELTDGPELLEAHYGQFQTTLEAAYEKAVEFRVAASTGHLALVARLICAAFGAALFDCSLDLDEARWQPVVGGVIPLSFPTHAIGPAGNVSKLLTGPIQTLTELTTDMSVSSKVLWGNVSSAVNGAVMAASAARPDLAARAMTLGHTLGQTLGTTPGPDFRRTSCCLIYRIAPPGSAPYCVDCVLQ